MSGLPGITPAGASVGLPADSGMPTVAATAEPEFVRNGSASVKSAYKEAVGFEAMLVEQLTKSMAQSGGLGEGGQAGGDEGEGESEGESAGATSLVSSMLPQTLSEALTRGGGLGLATQLTTEIDPAAATSGAKASS
jgi:Rod binding domain-containing protein